YGRSRFIPEEVVGINDAVDKWAGKGQVIPQWWEWDPPSPSHGTGVGWSGIHMSCWSTVYQWLPANVKFRDDGGVQFTSYINNLHPTKYRDIYGTIEELVKAALPMWDQCLVLDTLDCDHLGTGRHNPRMVPDDPEYVSIFLPESLYP